MAEVSSNHGGELERCLRFVDVAADVGCQAVKFQQFKVTQLFAPEALARHPELLERTRWELPEAFNPDLARRAHERGLAFSSTPFYLSAVGVLEPWVDFFKVSSYQVLWHELLREVARTEKPVVLSTGMATLSEVKAAVDVVWDAGCRDLTLLHCVSCYPTRPLDANLAAIGTLREAFGTPVGWSDHTVDPGVVLRAARRWRAALIEFHLDIDGEGDEFRGGHCWLPSAIARVVEKARVPRREAESSPLDGYGHVRPRPAELHERDWRTDPSDGLRPLRATRAGLRASVDAEG